MKASVVAVIFAAFLQVEARSARIIDDFPESIRETIEQSNLCAQKLGSKVSYIEFFQGREEYPENNDVLNQISGCIYEKKGIIKDNNEVNSGKLHDYLIGRFSIYVTTNAAQKWADEINATCKTVKGDEYQLTSLRIQNCINRETKKRQGM